MIKEPRVPSRRDWASSVKFAVLASVLAVYDDEVADTSIIHAEGDEINSIEDSMAAVSDSDCDDGNITVVDGEVTW